MLAFFADLKYGLRMLRKHPGLAAISVLALGLGLGLTAMMWSINYGVLLRPLPLPGGDRIMAVWQANPERHFDRVAWTVPDFDRLRREQRSFVDVAPFNNGTINLAGSEGQPERYQGAYMSPAGFAMVGVRPLLGRFFTADEGQVGGPDAVVLGYDLWQHRFHGDRNIIGRTVRVNGAAAQVVGVMPKDFRFPFLEELWVPQRIDLVKETREHGISLAVFGKLKPGVTIDQAAQDVGAIVARLAREFPQTNKGNQVVIEPYTDSAIGPQPRMMLWTMMGAVLGVLLIACSNVANLLLARAAIRTREVAVRTALGASRWRIVSQLLTEALVLSALGALLGIGIAQFGIRWFNAALANARPPFWIVIRLDGPVLAFVALVTILAAAVSGILPALQATGTRVYEVLKDESRGASSLRLGRFSKALVVFEMALSGGLLIGAGFMIESVVKRSEFNYGVPTAGVFTARIGLFEATYPDSAARARFWTQVLERVANEPGQQGVALMTQLPGLQANRPDFALDGKAYPDDRDYPHARQVAVSRGFFDAFSLHPLEGRVFTAEDDGTAQPVAVVTRNFAAKYFAGTSAVGHRIRFGGAHSTEAWRTIVGVVPDVWYQGTDDNTPETVITPVEQGDNYFMSLAVNAGARDPMGFAAAVRRDVAAVDPDQPIYFVMPLAARIAQDGWFYDLFGKLFMAFGAAALFLAAIGVYGVMSFAVGRRTQEVGIRMALGAGRADVLRMFLRQGAWQVGTGLVLALGLAGLLSRGLRIVLFQVNVNDPRMFAAVLGALALTGLLATLIPARRATRVDPVVALRYD